MFVHKDLSKYEEDFTILNIKDEEAMLGILNTLDELAEITYYNFKNTKKYDKETKENQRRKNS